MKKSIIAASVASLAVAALPIAGVFAADGGQFTDTLHVTVQGGCTIEDSQADPSGSVKPGTYSDTDFPAVTIAAGTVGYINADSTGAVDSTRGKSFKIMCNEESTTPGAKAWQVKVEGSNLTATGATPIAPGNTYSGNVSAWGIKSNAQGNNADYATSFQNPFAAYKGVATAGTEELFLQADLMDSAVTFNPSYEVYVSPSQEQGAYTGTAIYRVYLPD